jgi:hypothetical protein
MTHVSAAGAPVESPGGDGPSHRGRVVSTEEEALSVGVSSGMCWNLPTEFTFSCVEGFADDGLC